MISTAGKNEDLLLPFTCTALDLISFLQAKMFLAGPAVVIHDLKLIAEGRELRDNTIIGEVFCAGAGRLDAVPGSAWGPEQSTVSFRFCAGPPRHVLIPSCAPLAFVRAVICRIGQFSFDKVCLSAGGQEFSDRDMRRPLSELSDRLGDPWLVRGPVITVCFADLARGTYPIRVPQVPLSDRIFDMKAKLAEIKHVEACRIVLVLRGGVLSDGFPLTYYGVCNETIVHY
jgi:hypothetical protein